MNDPSKNPENRPTGKNRPEDILQPFKRVSGKVTENERFYQVYGGEKAKEFLGDPEKVKWLEKKYNKRK